MIYARRVKRKCDIRGCRNLDCYAISKSREAGNTVIICKECLEGGLDAIEKIGKESPAKKKVTSGPPPLFFADVLRVSDDTPNQSIVSTQKEVLKSDNLADATVKKNSKTKKNAKK